MQFESDYHEDILIVRVQEDQITMKEAPDVKTTLLSFMTDESDCILLNMARVKKMDSTGLGSILFGIRQAEQHEKDLAICEANDKVKFLIKIARLDEVIDVFDTEKEAIKELTAEEE